MLHRSPRHPGDFSHALPSDPGHLHHVSDVGHTHQTADVGHMHAGAETREVTHLERVRHALVAIDARLAGIQHCLQTSRDRIYGAEKGEGSEKAARLTPPGTLSGVDVALSELSQRCGALEALLSDFAAV